jgi:hypothetical protein
LDGTDCVRASFYSIVRKAGDPMLLIALLISILLVVPALMGRL